MAQGMSNHNWFQAGFAIWVWFQDYDDTTLQANLDLPRFLPGEKLQAVKCCKHGEL